MAPSSSPLKRMPSSWFRITSYHHTCFLGSTYHRDAIMSRTLPALDSTVRAYSTHQTSELEFAGEKKGREKKQRKGQGMGGRIGEGNGRKVGEGENEKEKPFTAWSPLHKILDPPLCLSI